MGCRKSITIFLYLMFVTSYGWAQTYRSTVYLEEDGLPSSDVLDITQASDGTMWFLTLKGIAQYDGVFWRSFPSETYKLPVNRIAQIVSLDSGKVITAGYNGKEFCIAKWNTKKWIFYELPEQVKIIGSSYFSFDAWERDGQLKIAVGNNTIYEYVSDTDKWKSLPYHRGTMLVKGNFTKQLKYDYTGKLWSATEEGLKENNGDRWVTLKTIEEESQRVLSLTFKEQSTQPYVLMDNLIGTWVNNQFEVILDNPTEDTGFKVGFHHMEFNSKNELFYSSNSSAYILKNGKSANLYFDDALLFAWCSAIVSDREDNIWIATGRGAVKLNEYSFRSYGANNGFYEDEVSAILELENGTIVLGSNHSFSTYLNGEISTRLIAPRGKVNNYRVLRIIEGKNNLVYFGSNVNGLGIWDRKKEIKWKLPESAPLPTINEIFILEDNLYVVSFNTIYKLNKDFSFSKIYAHPFYIRKVQVLPDGKVYLISNDILVFDGKQASSVYRLKNNAKESLFGICEWKDKVLVATLNGLYEVINNEIVPYELDSRLFENAVYALLVDSKENLWIGTSLGVFHVVDDEINHYSKNNGLIGNEINRNALIEDKDGNIWIGTDRGVSVYNYRNEINSRALPILKLKSVLSNKGSDYVQEKEITLSHDENTLEFGFVGVSFFDEKAINYRYRLESFDDKWDTLPYNQYPFARYTNLPYGSYRFEIQTRRGEEQWSNSVYSGQINIKRPFYSTPLFYVFIIFLIGGIGYLIRVFFVQRKNQLFLRRKVKEKIREIVSSEKKLKEKNEQLILLNKELDRFVYGVSHDLKAPLNSMTGLIQISKYTNDENEKSMMLKMMEDSVSKLRNFIGDLETYSRNKQKAINTESINFEQLVLSCIDTLKYSTEAQNVKLSYTVNQSEEYYSDANRINIILSNLLSNSIRYRNDRGEEAYAHISVELINSIAYIKVEDNGLGIEKDRINKIFDMFEKGEENKKGSSGLGLFIVKETVERLKGVINVKSELMKGTTFTVEIPSGR